MHSILNSALLSISNFNTDKMSRGSHSNGILAIDYGFLEQDRGIAAVFVMSLSLDAFDNAP